MLNWIVWNRTGLTFKPRTYTKPLLTESYSSAEVQYVYSTDPADSAMNE